MSRCLIYADIPVINANGFVVERDALIDVPNALGYQRVFETATNGYLVRQYFYSSLYDRMRCAELALFDLQERPKLTNASTRPFLEDIEKKWLAYQLLCALRDSHSRNIYHGDIKTENILVTSWNWLFLADYSSTYKSTYLPEDNPADFSYYFDTSGRRICYLAPERFLATGEKDDGRGVTWAMDVFSAGCVIAELFLEAPIFNLSQLYKYRKGEMYPESSYLSKIQDNDIREMVSHMIQLDPESRYSAEEYLNFWRRKAFPEYFYSFLHQYLGAITDPLSGRSPVIPEENFGEADERIDRVYYDYDKISYFLGHSDSKDDQNIASDAHTADSQLLPLQIDIPNNRHEATTAGRRPADDGSLIFLALVVSSLRNTARSTARVRALDLMLAFAERITDEAKLDRVLPYVISLLNDRADIVKIAAIRTMTQLLALTTVVSPVNVNIFMEYIRPRMQFVNGNAMKYSPCVRATYASCLASLAHTSAKILEMVQALRADGSIPTTDPEAEDSAVAQSAYQLSFDASRCELFEHFENHTKALLTDPNASVRRAFLGSVSSLCVFFGGSKANDVILSHLNTYLNDKDWILRCAFFKTIVGVATFVGGTSLEEFILPLMIQSLTDPEDFVIEQVISSLASMAELGLFQRSKTWEIVDVIARFLMHPNIWIREASAHFVAASTKYLSSADLYCIIMPLVNPYLRVTITEYSEVKLLDALEKPLSRPALDMAVVWATKGRTGSFWKSAQQQRSFSSASASIVLSNLASKDPRPKILSKTLKDGEDEQWLQRLRNIGLTPEDDFKLLALREYIWRISLKSTVSDADAFASPLNTIFPLKNIKVTPQTVFFETRPENRAHSRLAISSDRRSGSARDVPIAAPRTIADALLDASSTVDESSTGRFKTPGKLRKENSSGNISVRGETGRSSAKTKPSIPDSPHPRQDSKDGFASAHGDGASTPTDSSRTGKDPRRTSGSIRYKPSAIDLLNRKDISKTFAETGTSSTNAQGQMDGPPKKEHPDTLRMIAPSTSKQHSPVVMPASHSYDGSDPNVMKFLDSLAADNYPLDTIDFGPMVTPVKKRRPTESQFDVTSEKPWRPEGVLIGSFGEHEGSVNRVLPSPDHAFLITGSDDGTVKIWDTLRLERNLAHRSRQTYEHASAAKITSLCFVENTHTFVSAASDGSIHIVKIDYSLVGDISRYGKLLQVRCYQLRQDECAVWLEHFKADTASVLLVATTQCRILALNLKDMSEMYVLENPEHHGIPTCFCVNSQHTWLLLGTSHGVLSLWDLRFRLRLKAFGLAGGTPIHRVLVHPFRTRLKKVVVTGGTGHADITVWDLEKAECTEVFRMGPPRGDSGVSRETSRAYDAWKVDDNNAEGMLGRFATTIDTSDKGDKISDNGMRALAIRLDESDSKGESKTGFYLTGGVDRRLRIWDTLSMENSKILSGLDPGEDQPKYSTTQPKTGLTIHRERGILQASLAPSPANAITGKPVGTGARAGIKQPRSSIIGAQQKALLKNHLDVVTDVCLLERPVKMTVSADRLGCIYVFR